MNHLSDDMIYTLAVKVACEHDLSPAEEDALLHVAECDECYHMLSCMMAMQNVAQHIGSYAVEAPVSVRETVTAVLKLAVDKVNTILDQIESGANGWSFRQAPLALAGVRSRGKRSAAKKLTDTDNAKTFVAYDPDKKLLIIQIDGSACDAAPSAFLRLPDGQQTEIPLEKREDLYWGEVHGLEEGSYDIILEK